jgi:carbon monoxide dehydrogenase subunit G
MTTRNADWSKRTAKKTPGTTVDLDDSIVLPATPDLVWSRLEDVPLVASCLPGLDTSTLVAAGPNRFTARMTNTVMGISANWDLTATIDPDAERRHLIVALEGEDGRLNMKLNGAAQISVRPDSLGQALIAYTGNLRVDGSLAAMGAPVIRSILSDAIAQFVAVVGGQAPSERLRLFERLRRFFRRLWRRTSEGSDVAVAKRAA